MNEQESEDARWLKPIKVSIHINTSFYALIKTITRSAFLQKYLSFCQHFALGVTNWSLARLESASHMPRSHLWSGRAEELVTLLN